MLDILELCAGHLSPCAGFLSLTRAEMTASSFDFTHGVVFKDLKALGSRKAQSSFRYAPLKHICKQGNLCGVSEEVALSRILAECHTCGRVEPGLVVLSFSLAARISFHQAFLQCP